MTPPRSLGRLRPVLLAAALVVLPLAACGDDDEGAGRTTSTTADVTTTTSADTTTSTSEPGGTSAGTVVAVLSDGSVAMLDPGTGDVRETLLDGVDVTDPSSNDITVTPDGTEVFVVRPVAGERSEIVRLHVDGEGPEVVARGSAPAVSPDGSTLAYVDLQPTEAPGQPEPLVVLHDLRTGEERRLESDEGPGYYFIADMAWTADGEQVAFVAGEIQTDLHIVDADAASLDDARRVGPEARDDGTSWTAVTTLDEDRLAVVERCCDLPDAERWQVVAVHVESSIVDGPLLPQEQVRASGLDGHPSATALLVVSDLRPGGGTLQRWKPPADSASAGGGGLVHLRDGVVAAAW